METVQGLRQQGLRGPAWEEDQAACCGKLHEAWNPAQWRGLRGGDPEMSWAGLPRKPVFSWTFPF